MGCNPRPMTREAKPATPGAVRWLAGRSLPARAPYRRTGVFESIGWPSGRTVSLHNTAKPRPAAGSQLPAKVLATLIPSPPAIIPSLNYLGLLGAVGQRPFTVDWGPVPVGHLPGRATDATPDSHAARRVRDQSARCGEPRGGLRCAHRGRFHINAEHDRERRSKAHTGQSTKIYFHRAFPPLSNFYLTQFLG